MRRTWPTTPVAMRGEFLHAFFVTERVKSHLPVQLHSAGVEMRPSAALRYG